jgi:hypothetical protein
MFCQEKERKKVPYGATSEELQRTGKENALTVEDRIRTWKMRFFRRRALVCDAKLGDLGPAAARSAAEGGSMARRQFLVFRC